MILFIFYLLINLSNIFAANIKFFNNCSNNIELCNTSPIKLLLPNTSFSKYWDNMVSGTVFKHSLENSATLAEFSSSNMGIWYDISIIPTSNISGPDNCMSLDECKLKTHSSGWNVPMKIEPIKFDSNSILDQLRCKTLICLEDGCPDAYLYPSDDIKTHVCPKNTNFTITFCPNGGIASDAIFYDNKKFIEEKNISLYNDDCISDNNTIILTNNNTNYSIANIGFIN